MEGRKNIEQAAPQSKKKPRIRWTKQLHDCFLTAVYRLGGAYKATPKDIVKLMDMREINSTHIKSHLQQYRLNQDMYETIKRNAARNSKVMIFAGTQENVQQGRTVRFLTNEAPRESAQTLIAKQGAFFYTSAPLKEANNVGKAVAKFHQSRDDFVLSAGLQGEKGSSSVAGMGSETKLATNDRPFDLNVSAQGM